MYHTMRNNFVVADSTPTQAVDIIQAFTKQIGKILYFYMCRVDIRTFQRGKGALDRELFNLRVAKKRKTKILRLDKALPVNNDIALYPMRYGNWSGCVTIGHK